MNMNIVLFGNEVKNKYAFVDHLLDIQVSIDSPPGIHAGIYSIGIIINNQKVDVHLYYVPGGM